MSFMISSSKKTFGPSECWCSQHGQVFYPCKKNKLCKETNIKYQQMRKKYIASKTHKNIIEKRKKTRLLYSKKRREYIKTKSYKNMKIKWEKDKSKWEKRKKEFMKTKTYKNLQKNK